MTAIDLLTSLYENDISLEICNDLLKVRADKGKIDERFLNLIRDNKSELMDLLKSLNGNKHTLLDTSEDNSNPSSSQPVSYEQKAMLWLDKVSEVKYHYNMSAAYRLTGELDESILSDAFTEVIGKHTILRTVYVIEQGEERQKIQHTRQFPIDRVVLDASNNVDNILEEHAKKSFNLSNDLPVRALLIFSDDRPNEKYLCISMHHIVADGWSVTIFLRELSDSYNNRLHNTSSNLSDNNFTQYFNYSRWQRENISKGHYNDSLNYWKERLENLPVLHNLPTDFPRPSTQNFNGFIYQKDLPGYLEEKIHNIISERAITPFVFFQCAFTALLKRYTDDEDIVFGTVIANRSSPELINTIGMFANSLVLRYSVDDDCSFNKLIIQAEEVSQSALNHGELPFEMLVETLQPERSLAYNPLIQIMLVMQEDYHQQLQLEKIDTEFIENDCWVSKFDLSLHLTNKQNQWNFRWEYNTDLFKMETIERINNHFFRMIELLLEYPDKPITTLPLVLLDELPISSIHRERPENNCVHSVIADHMLNTPEKLAVFSNTGSLTYRQLSEKVESLAKYLWVTIAHDARTSLPFVGVCLERDIDLVVSLLAIFRIGGVYVPIDPAYPKERIAHMVADSGIKALITNENVDESIRSSINLPKLILNQITKDQDVGIGEMEYPSLTPKDTAYVIYTSGSTGKPKGVLVSHENLFQSLYANSRLMGFTTEDTMPCLGSVAFGASLLEMLLPLTNGATLHMLPKSEVADVTDLVRNTSKNTTVVHMVPSLLKLWLFSLKRDALRDDSNLYPNLRLMLTGGEAVPKYLLDDFQQKLPGTDILGLYGMTEAAIVCFSHKPDNDLDPNHCLGRPHPHMQAFVLNSRQQIQPLGCSGELHLCGASIAQGYLNQPDYTTERFIECNFPGYLGERLYMTGDSARLRGDGRFEFLGRVDNQVSINGFRIELGEIEESLRKHEKITEVIVTVASDSTGHQQLAAYFVTCNTLEKYLSTADLRDYLADLLPSYMIPSHFIALDEFPLNPNGKINRNALPEIEFERGEEIYIRPSTEKELVLSKIWSDVLNIPEDRISIEDNFFNLGGDSILSLKAIDMAKSAGISVTPQNFFQNQTIAGLAKFASNESEYQADPDGKVPLTFRQKSIFNIKKFNENHYHAAIMRDISGKFDSKIWFQAVEMLLIHHPGLRTVFHYDNENWSATIKPIEQCDFFEIVDFSLIDQNEQKNTIHKHIHETIDISRGPLIKLFIFENSTTQTNSFLLVIHHLIMDRVSLEIISDDFHSLIFQLSEGKDARLPKRLHQ